MVIIREKKVNFNIPQKVIGKEKTFSKTHSYLYCFPVSLIKEKRFSYKTSSFLYLKKTKQQQLLPINLKAKCQLRCSQKACLYISGKKSKDKINTITEIHLYIEHKLLRTKLESFVLHLT